MKPKINLRKIKISDAKEFYRILNNENFVFFNSQPKTIKEEKEYLKSLKEQEKNNFSYNFAIIYNKKIAGGCGIKIDQHRPFIGEIGYFVDEKYWGKGMATQAVKLLEKFAFNKLGLKRLVILMALKNVGSKKVAIKNGYKKEGILKKAIKVKGKFLDAYIFAKTIG